MHVFKKIVDCTNNKMSFIYNIIYFKVMSTSHSSIDKNVEIIRLDVVNGIQTPYSSIVCISFQWHNHFIWLLKKMTFIY